MKYLCLVYAEEAPPRGGRRRALRGLRRRAARHGRCLASEALQPVATATTVRVRGGKVSVTDGPFAETKEQLTGFYLIEAEDLNDAIRIASASRRRGSAAIEVRPVRPSARPSAGRPPVPEERVAAAARSAGSGRASKLAAAAARRRGGTGVPPASACV